MKAAPDGGLALPVALLNNYYMAAGVESIFFCLAIFKKSRI
jgi:hypothetical protein